ncbi:MAG: HEPN domain-containing protein [bacterium]
MKKRSLFKQLYKKGKLLLVEPSDDIKNAYLKKSESGLSSAKILLDNEKLEESISLAYYSMYYITLALFFKTGIKCENHSATIILLKRIFGIDNSHISFAKRERVDKQYYVGFHIAKKDVKDLIKIAEDFNAKIYDFIDRFSNNEIEKYRKKIRDSLE